MLFKLFNLPGLWYPGESISPRGRYDTPVSQSPRSIKTLRVNKNCQDMTPQGNIPRQVNLPRESVFLKPKIWITQRNLNRNWKYFNPLVTMVSGPWADSNNEEKKWKSKISLDCTFKRLLTNKTWAKSRIAGGISKARSQPKKGQLRNTGSHRTTAVTLSVP